MSAASGLLHPNPARTWYATDALGSVRLTMGDTGAALSSIDYDPWGAVERGTVARFGFTGELQQGSSVHLRARWYNTTSGSFASVDPYAGDPASPASLAPYMYAYNQPTGFTDPSGRCISWVLGAWNPDPSCQFIGMDKVRQGQLNYRDGVKDAGKAAVVAGSVAATAIACAGTAGFGCVAGTAAAGAVASWGDQALDNAGQPWTQAATNVDGGKIARDAALAAVSVPLMGLVSKGASKLFSTVATRWLKWPGVCPLAEARAGGAAVASETYANIADDAIEQGTGALGGKLFGKERLQMLEEYLAKNGVILKVGDSYLQPGQGGKFIVYADGRPAELILCSNPTEYIVWHELFHYVQYKRMNSLLAYIEIPRGEVNFAKQFVFDMLERPEIWNRLNPREQQHAIDYILSVGGSIK